MPVSKERIEANRRNAAKSTGPRTAEGKERSRANALKHGLTGEGVALPGEDAEEIRRRFEALGDEMKPSGELARILVKRVAMLSVRLDRCARHEAAVLASKVRAAEVEEEDRRLTEVEKLFDWIAAEPATNARRLENTPEGVDRLIRAWGDLATELSGSSRWGYVHLQRIENLGGRRPEDYPASRAGALARAVWGDFAGLKADDGANLDDDGRREWAREQLLARIDAEIDRLRDRRARFNPDDVARDRAGAVERALFDPSPQATLARKYEAAAERGLYRALREFRTCGPLGDPAFTPNLDATPDDQDVCDPLGSSFPGANGPVPGLSGSTRTGLDPAPLAPGQGLGAPFEGLAGGGGVDSGADLVGVVGGELEPEEVPAQLPGHHQGRPAAAEGVEHDVAGVRNRRGSRGQNGLRNALKIRRRPLLDDQSPLPSRPRVRGGRHDVAESAVFEGTMGYTTYGYAVDIDRLRSVFGSNDRALLERIDGRDGDAMRRQDERFSDRIREGAPTRREALAQILEGKIAGPDWAGFQYGYATELLCAHLGHWVEGENLIESVEDLEIPTGLSNFGRLLPVPQPDDFPDVRFLTAAQVREEYERLRGQDLSHDDEDLEAAREEFRSYLRQAYEKGLGLVTFAY